MPQDHPLLVAQLTDTHLFANEHGEMFGVRTAQSLRAVLEEVKPLQPQPNLLLLTGDLSQDETLDSYIHLREVISSLDIPAYWLPGNHDTPSLMEQILETTPISPEKSLQVGNWNVLLLNSAVPECVYGKLSSESLAWLEEQLQQKSEQPTLVALHHPPVAIASTWMDEINLRNPEDLYVILDRHPQVKVVLFGHIHQEFDTYRNAIRYLGTPSTCVQFQPQSREFAIDELQPGFRLLTLYADGSHATTVKRIAYG